MEKPSRQLGITIRELADGEEMAAADLVMRTFGAYVGHEYSDEGVEEFARYAEASAMRARLDRRECLVLVAVLGDDPVGLIEFRGSNHLSMLFVDARFHRRGIARALLDEAIERFAATGAESRHIDVNSSRYAIPAYQRLGFEVSGQEQTINGITFTPMRRRHPQGQT